MKKAAGSPLSFRANETDMAILAELQERLGLLVPQVIRLALRRLLEEEQRRKK